MSLKMMSMIEEIEAVIGVLPREDFWKLTDKLIAKREAARDAQMAADAASGRLDALWAQADKEVEAGESQYLDAFLGHQKL